MARFDLYRSRLNEGYLVDCQADVLSALATRLVIPLLPEGSFPLFDQRLNPIMMIGDEHFVLATQAAVSVPIPQLGRFAGSLAHEDFTITAALDMLLTGY